jgi:hypothetical protein
MHIFSGRDVHEIIPSRPILLVAGLTLLLVSGAAAQIGQDVEGGIPAAGSGLKLAFGVSVRETYDADVFLPETTPTPGDACTLTPPSCTEGKNR